MRSRGVRGSIGTHAISVFRSGALATIIALGFAMPASAKSVAVKNTGDGPVTLSDITVYAAKGQKGTATVVLVSNDTSDDVILTPGQTSTHNTDKDENAIQDWNSKAVSFTNANGEVETKSNGDGLFPIFTPDVVTGLYISVCTEPVAPIAEGTIFVVVAGLTGALPSLFFSTTDFGYVDEVTCVLDGTETGFTGTVIVLGSYEVSSSTAVPTASQSGLIFLTLLLLTSGAIVMLRRRRPSMA